MWKLNVPFRKWFLPNLVLIVIRIWEAHLSTAGPLSFNFLTSNQFLANLIALCRKMSVRNARICPALLLDRRGAAHNNQYQYVSPYPFCNIIARQTHDRFIWTHQGQSRLLIYRMRSKTTSELVFLCAVSCKRWPWPNCIHTHFTVHSVKNSQLEKGLAVSVPSDETRITTKVMYLNVEKIAIWSEARLPSTIVPPAFCLLLNGMWHDAWNYPLRNRKKIISSKRSEDSSHQHRY